MLIDLNKARLIFRAFQLELSRTLEQPQSLQKTGEVERNKEDRDPITESALEHGKL